MNASQIHELFSTYVMPLIWRLTGAIVLWIVGRQIVRLIGTMLGKLLARRAEVDPTLLRYARSATGGILTVLLIIAVLSVLGVETASFAALLAAAGVAIGMAWSGLLANFAAGVFLIWLRPFKVGDSITAAGVSGTVREIGLFGTTLDTADNLKVTIGNNKIFADNIVNYSANAYRRIALTVQLAHGVDAADARTRLRAAVAPIPGVLANPAPVVDILEYNAQGTSLVVYLFCSQSDSTQVTFDGNRAIGEVGKAAGWPIPETRQAVRQV